MGHEVNRRLLMLALGSAAMVLPAEAYPQPMSRIAVLMGPGRRPETEAWLMAFYDKLHELGRTDRGNIAIDLRWGNGDMRRIRALAAELVNTKPDVIVCFSVRVLKVLKEKTQDIPIVFIATSDPVAQGMVASFSHPGGNLTGFTLYEFSVTGKLAELAKEMVPGLARVGLLYNPENTSAKGYLRTLERVAPRLGVILVPLAVRDAATIEDALSRFAAEPNGALLLPPDVTIYTYRDRIIRLAETHKLPAIYSTRADVVAGGLISYGPDLRSQFRGAAIYVDRILKGQRPGDLPVQSPTRYALFVNARTARTLGLASSPKTCSRVCLTPSAPGSLISATSRAGNIEIEVRNAAGHNDRLPAFVADLLRRKVEVILAVNTPAAKAAKKATATVPIIIMRVADPMEIGLDHRPCPPRQQRYRPLFHARHPRREARRTAARVAAKGLSGRCALFRRQCWRSNRR